MSLCPRCPPQEPGGKIPQANPSRKLEIARGDTRAAEKRPEPKRGGGKNKDKTKRKKEEEEKKKKKIQRVLVITFQALPRLSWFRRPARPAICMYSATRMFLRRGNAPFLALSSAQVTFGSKHQVLCFFCFFLNEGHAPRAPHRGMLGAFNTGPYQCGASGPEAREVWLCGSVVQ